MTSTNTPIITIEWRARGIDYTRSEHFDGAVLRRAGIDEHAIYPTRTAAQEAIDASPDDVSGRIVVRSSRPLVCAGCGRGLTEQTAQTDDQTGDTVCATCRMDRDDFRRDHASV